jgi:hypothetical protein
MRHWLEYSYFVKPSLAGAQTFFPVKARAGERTYDESPTTDSSFSISASVLYRYGETRMVP